MTGQAPETPAGGQVAAELERLASELDVTRRQWREEDDRTLRSSALGYAIGVLRARAAEVSVGNAGYYPDGPLPASAPVLCEPRGPGGLPPSDPATDPAGTVRREEHRDGHAIWVRLGQRSGRDWVCVHDTLRSPLNQAACWVPCCVVGAYPVIGAVPGTPAAGSA